jgi:hypothetical protein
MGVLPHTISQKVSFTNLAALLTRNRNGITPMHSL